MKGWATKWKKNGWWLNNKERAKNIDLWEKLLPLCERHRVEFSWLKGHAGNRENERCDHLSMAALREPNLPSDIGYENKPASEEIRPALQEGEPCRKCSTPVIKKQGKRKPRRDYYFEYHLFCPKCQTTYPVEQAKRTIQQTPTLF